MTWACYRCIFCRDVAIINVKFSIISTRRKVLLEITLSARYNSGSIIIVIIIIIIIIIITIIIIIIISYIIRSHFASWFRNFPLSFLRLFKYTQ